MDIFRMFESFLEPSYVDFVYTYKLYYIIRHFWLRFQSSWAAAIKTWKEQTYKLI